MEKQRTKDRKLGQNKVKKRSKNGQKGKQQTASEPEEDVAEEAEEVEIRRRTGCDQWYSSYAVRGVSEDFSRYVEKFEDTS